jgi:nitrogenase molybdenum-iron protein alpha/beta subunit
MPSDDQFWRRNERFFTERMGQPCCTLAGISKMLAHLPGNFAVVVHGEMDCLNNFPHFEGGSLDRFYCTHVSQHEFAAGDTARPLRQCLDAVIEAQAPDAVFVLSMCLMEMIHDDFPRVTSEIAARTGVPIVPLRTSGLEVVSEAEYIDSFYCELGRLFPAPPRPEPGLVNFVGLPALGSDAAAELARALDAAGLRMSCSYPIAAGLDDWRRIGCAAANFVVDTPLYPRFVAALQASRVPCHDVPLPAGLAQTQSFYHAIGEAAGRRQDVERAVAGAADATRAAVDSFKRRFQGLRLAVGLRMANFNGPAQLALDGLAEVRAFLELGLDVTLLIQGPPDVRGRSYFQSRLQALGFNLPSLVFAEPGELTEHLGSGRFDLAYMRDHARQYTQRAGIALITTGTLRPLLCGALDNVKAITRAAESRRVAAAATVS